MPSIRGVSDSRGSVRRRESFWVVSARMVEQIPENVAGMGVSTTRTP
jgi:hypothetical protein